MKIRCQPVSAAALSIAGLLGVAAINVDPGMISGVADLVATAVASSQGPTPPFIAGCPLVEPPVIAAQSGILNLDLNATPATVNLGGSSITTHVYNPNSKAVLSSDAAACLHQSSMWLPPTMQVNPGDEIRLNLANNQTDTGWDDNLHFHGMHVTPGFDAEDPTKAGDNVFLDIPPGGTQNYELDIPKDNPVGTYWYHNHMTPAEPQLFAGQAGLLKVGNLNNRLPYALQGVRTRDLMLKDMQFNPGTGTVLTSNIISGDPTTRLVNGELQPTFDMAVGEVQHLTFANTGADIYYDIQFDNHSFFVIGVDGNPVFRVTRASHLLLPPAKRFDVLVTTNSTDRAGSTGTIRTLQYVQGTVGDTYPDTVLATVHFTSPPDSASASGSSSQQQALQSLVGASLGGEQLGGTVTDTRTVYFNEDPNANTFSIAMQPQFAPNIQTRVPLPEVDVPAGQNVSFARWTIANTTLENHDFHIHINPFQVLAVSDPNASCPNALTPVSAFSLEDTLNLPQAQQTATAVQCAGDPAPTTLHFGRIVFKTEFKDFFGQSVGDPQGRIKLHCHIEAHLDNGMITWFEVVRQGGDTLPSDSKD